MDENKININNNAFDIVGLMATMSILIGHTIGYSGVIIENSVYKILANFFAIKESVAIIFTISGFLVAASYERTKGTGRFLLKRIIRIYPALTLVIVIPSMVYIFMGYVQIDIMSYLRFLVRRVLFQTRPDLVPDGAIGNASLWTIVMQMQFYLLTPVFVRLIKKCSILAGTIVVGVFVIYNVITPAPQIDNMWLEFMYYTLCFPYFYMYLIGVVCYLKREIMVPWLKDRAYFLVICYVILQCVVRLDFQYEWNYINPFSGVIACLMAIGLSYRIGGKHISIDPSYGIYLWHMPILEGIHYLLKIDYSLPVVFATLGGGNSCRDIAVLID